MATKVGIIGSGNVGSALERGLKKVGYEAQVSNKANMRDVAQGAEAVILAVPYGALDDVIKNLGSALDGKVVIDVTNLASPQMTFVTLQTSGAEELQKKIPKAKVVKAFNTVYAQHMDSGKVNGQQVTMFVAADDESARNQVLKMAKDIGFDPLSAGPLANAKHLESMGFLNIQLGYVLGNGINVGYKYIR